MDGWVDGMKVCENVFIIQDVYDSTLSSNNDQASHSSYSAIAAML